MNKIIRIWNQNRGKIIIIALVVVFLFIFIQILNQIAKEQRKKENNNISSGIVGEDLPDKSIITGETVKEETTKTNVQTIETFVEKCNEGDIEAVYDLLTDECKEVLFSTQENFVNNYYNIIFKEPRTIKIENYKNSSNNNTYKVTFYGDVLSTGDISSSDKYTDYITVDKESKKLNINSLITSKEMNAKTEQNGIKITAVRKNVYIEYEDIEVRVENNTDKTIMLDTKKRSKTIYSVGNDNIKYSANINNIPSSLFQLQKYVVKTYTIRFNKIYDSDIKTKKVCFTDIIEDYEKYTKEQNNERLKIEVEL